VCKLRAAVLKILTLILGGGRAPWRTIPTGKRTTGDTASECAFMLASKWISSCFSNHQRCKKSPELTLPARVLDVKENVVRLYETQGEGAPYVCLSHCWGPTQIITTTRDTMDEHKMGIPWSSLPKTFQDAITLVRRLSLRYIWIDSLCIVQDDDDDWKKEARQMARIYENAYLTIAATKSSSGSGGLFCKTPDFEMVETASADHPPYQIFAREQIHHLPLYPWGSPDIFPLLTRGWVYQERLLSQRVLHFGPQELFWECAETTSCECSAINVGGYPVNRPKVAHSRALAQEPGSPPLAWRWRTMVSEYSGLKLTRASDRLPAFSGVATQMMRYRKSKYLAGMWLDSITDDLLWRTQTPGRPEEWRAPSWSWASVNSTIAFADGVGMPLETIYVSVVGVHCQQTPDSPIGVVSSGEIEAYGQMVSATIVPIRGPETAHDTFMNVERAGICAQMFYPDIPFSTTRSPNRLHIDDKIHCLRIAANRQYEFSLAMRVFDEAKMVYERVGLIHMEIGRRPQSVLGWYDGVIKGSVRVV
jgi:Heterokaryon incompatibility protein (HET)